MYNELVLKNKNVKVCFFTIIKKEKLQFQNYINVDIQILESLGYKVIVCDNFFEIPYDCSIYFSWWASGSIIPLIKTFLLKKPLICVAGGTEAIEYKDSVDNIGLGYLSTPFYKKLATNLVLKLSYKICVVSNFMYDKTKKLGAKNICVIPNCVDTDFFMPSINEKKHFLSVFNFDKNVIKLKRGYNLINSFKNVLVKYPNELLYLIGNNGNGKKDLLNYINENNLEKNVFIIDALPNTELLRFIQASKSYIQLSDVETFGMTIAEAMSCEIPVIVSNKGAIPEVVGNDGIYVDNNSISSITNSLLYFLELDDLKKIELGRRLRSRIIEKYSINNRKILIKNLMHDILNVK